MSQTVVLKVKMSCSGCSGAVKRVLDKMEGVESYDINMEEQKVTVNGNVLPEAVFETVSKTGKKTELWVVATTPSESAPETVTSEAEPKATEPATKPIDQVVGTDDAKATEVVQAETKPPTDEPKLADETKLTETVETETKPEVTPATTTTTT